MKAFLSAYDVVFVSSAKQAIKKGFGSSSQIITWASKDQTEVNRLVKDFGGIPWQIEDGFIRSAGLGSDLTAPSSLVLDKTGIYYDPTAPSDLETLLQTKQFSKDELKRAEFIKASLLEKELSKYNLGGDRFDLSSVGIKPNQNIILIPGQVEDDASIQKGCVDVDTNSKLVQAVKNKEPNAFIIYKPHPDVSSGNRKGKVKRRILEKNVDLVLIDVSITDCLAVVDEVHTMTSLVGFEGLLRKLKVVCYGLPFYSNWGLTVDHHLLPRRTRKLQLSQLVAGVFVDYPYYINWETGKSDSPETIVKRLKEEIDKQGGKNTNNVFWLIRQLRKGINIYRGVFQVK